MVMEENLYSALSSIQDKTAVEWMVITPEIAKKMLGTNHNIRTISPHTVSGYARDIISNAWRINGETITFNENNELVDGQHRLAAVIKANKPIISLVVRNVPDTDVYDIGKKRSTPEILRAEGYTKTNTTIAGVAPIILYGFANKGQMQAHGSFEIFEFLRINADTLAEVYELTTHVKSCMCRKSSVVAALFCIRKVYENPLDDLQDIVTIASTGMPLDNKLSTPGLALRLTLSECATKWDAQTRYTAFDATYQAYIDYVAKYDRKRKYMTTNKSQKLLEKVREMTTKKS